MIKNDRGLLLVISGPSGVVKGTICKQLFDDTTILSVSATTRNPRPGEKDGVDYFFYSKEEFEKMIENNELMEWAEYCGNYYGTPEAFVEENLKNGKNVILEIEVQGAMKIKSKHPEGVYIFVLPPSLKELRNRIVGRGTETEEVILARLEKAKREIDQLDAYDYIVYNYNGGSAVAADDIKAIVRAEKLARHRQPDAKKKYFELD